MAHTPTTWDPIPQLFPGDRLPSGAIIRFANRITPDTLVDLWVWRGDRSDMPTTLVYFDASGIVADIPEFLSAWEPVGVADAPEDLEGAARALSAALVATAGNRCYGCEWDYSDRMPGATYGDERPVPQVVSTACPRHGLY